MPNEERDVLEEGFWRRRCQPTPVFLPGESHGQRSLAGYSPWGCRELDTTERLTHTSGGFHQCTQVLSSHGGQDYRMLPPLTPRLEKRF